MRKYFFVCSTLLLVTLAGCVDEPPTVGRAVELEQVCDQAKDGERVSIEGYLTLPQTIPGDNKVTLLLELRPSESVENMDGKVGVWTKYGNEANRVSPIAFTTQSPGAGDYTHEALKVTASDGQQITYTDRVRVSGNVKFPTSSEVLAISRCVLNNPLIERIEQPNS
ncbi:hypothetical protein H6G89_13085 [Oscillatoria sp. FACHB-1407]|uniref:hypothetical protein n=1 Tax=Oscillatoria sp. FACHB-1407 TaxID=2692847 RepID=UPI001689FE03|nr:hypothetical protein [Oscillatoria sp. FACHB-1407]MBD2461982.1 hypothetical protein [Oscillatoria sp. FACHB-1407]